MKASLVRSAYSPVIYEAHDCSVGLYSDAAETLGEAPGLPFFTGALDGAIREVIAHIDPHEFFDGDTIVLNDPYITGSHLNDVTCISPVLLEGEVIGYTACKAHWEDVGAANTLSVMSREIYEEGLRFGPVYVMRAGEPVRDVIDIFMRNSRRPQALRGDLNAQIASCRMGVRRHLELVERFGYDRLLESVRQVFDTTEELEREAVAQIPDGVYEAEAFGDLPPTESEPLFVKVRVIVDGSELTIDTRGSSGMRQGSGNTGLNQSISGLRLAYKFLIRPDLGVTGGSFRNLSLHFDEPSAFAAVEPAAVFAYGEAPALAIDLTIRALAPAMPDVVTAGGPGSSWNVGIFGPHPAGGGFAAIEALAGGWGATSRTDGDSATIHMDAGDFKNTPIEVTETRYPVKVRRYSLGQDSAGAGAHRGGLNVIKEYEPLVDGCRISSNIGRTATPSWGLFGGGDGAAPEAVLRQEGEERSVLVSSNVPFPRGSVLQVSTGGGGGFGVPWERPVEAVVADVLDGRVSRDRARDVYGVLFQGDTDDVDLEATERRRTELCIPPRRD
jgi:N-methylhydantoinase B